MEQSLADCVGKRRDEQNERDHLGREEEESKGIAGDSDEQRTTSLSSNARAEQRAGYLLHSHLVLEVMERKRDRTN